MTSSAGLERVAQSRPNPYVQPMTAADVISTLLAKRAHFESQGVVHMSIFGSVARGDNTPESDVDIAVQLDRTRKLGLLELARIRTQLVELLGCEVDLVSEPSTRKPRLQAEIDRHRVAAF